MNPSSPQRVMKKMRFSPSNVDMYERMFKLEHDVAMGYKQPAVPRVPKVKTALDQFMEDHPVPSPLHESFRCWIARNAMAKFDCFEDPNYLCECYKCATWQKQEDHQYTIMEFAKSEHETLMLKTDVSGISAVDRFMKTEQEPSSRTVNNMPSVSKYSDNKENINIPVNVGSVCHFFTDFDLLADEAPQTPKLTTVTFDPESDQGKAEAQLKWARRVQHTPTNLRF